MKKSLLLFLFFVFELRIGLAQAPNIQWAKCLGGSDNDRGYSVKQTFDGGFIVAGYSKSINGDISNNHGGEDVWIIKLDSLGNIEWQKCLGGSWDERACDIRQLPDSGFIIAGNSDSFDGDVTNVHGFVDDYWLVKLEKNGVIDWQKCLGGSNLEIGKSATNDFANGYAIVGTSNSSDGDVSMNHGSDDIWVAKTDSTGNLVWQKSLGGMDYEFDPTIVNSNDNCFVISGYTASADGDVTGNHGGFDGWLVKLDSAGSIIWEHAIGGSSLDGIYSIKSTTDSGFIAAGSTQSNDFDVSGNHGAEDFWLVKLNTSGNIIWQNCFGGSNVDAAFSVSTTSDGGYVLTGPAGSNDGQITSWMGGSDIWIVKTDNFGNLEWQKSIGGSDVDESYSIEQTRDDGYILAGHTFSHDSDVVGNHSFFYEDAWVVKLAPLGLNIPESNLLKNFTCYADQSQCIHVTYYSNHNELISVQIIDITGRTLFESPLHSELGFNNHKIPALNSPSGIYFIRLQSENGRFVKKLMIN